MKIIKKFKIRSFDEIKKEFLWMFRYVKKYHKSLIFYIGAGIVSTIMVFWSSLISKKLIDVITGFDSGKITIYIILMIVTMITKIVIDGFIKRTSTKIEIMIHNQIQYDVYAKVINSSWQKLNVFRSGDIVNRINSDVKIVAANVINWLPSAIIKLLQFIGAFIIIFYYDPIMAMFALASAPLTMVVSKFLMHKMRKYSMEIRKLSSDIMSFHNDSFINIQTIKAFGITDYFINNFENIQKEYQTKALEFNKFSIYTSSIMSIFSIFVSLGCFSWGIYRLYLGQMSYGTMVLFIQLASNLTNSFSGLIGLIPKAINATTSAGRIIAITELPKEKIYEIKLDEMTKRNIEQNGLTLSINKMSFAYQQNNVLTDVSLTVKPGETIAIVGPSGEGKTTMMRIMLGLLTPQSGECKLIDSQGNEYPLSSSTRQFFGYVPQGNTILPGTVLKNMLMMNPDASHEEMYLALKRACADEFISDLNQEIGENGKGFSEGQAQRLSIAMALLKPAPILIFDEATAALDIFHARKVITNVMKRDKKQTCIITTHRYSILSICDHVYQIKNKKLVKLSREDILQLERIF